MVVLPDCRVCLDVSGLSTLRATEVWLLNGPENAVCVDHLDAYLRARHQFTAKIIQRRAERLTLENAPAGREG